MQLAKHDHQSAETMDELRALNARFIDNFVTSDVASHDAILHPDFINIWPTGQRWDRASYLKYWATAFDPESHRLLGCPRRTHHRHRRRRAGALHQQAHAPPRRQGSDRHDDVHRYLSVRERRLEMHPGPTHAGCSRTPARRRYHRQRLYRGKASGAATSRGPERSRRMGWTAESCAANLRPSP